MSFLALLVAVALTAQTGARYDDSKTAEQGAGANQPKGTPLMMDGYAGQLPNSPAGGVQPVGPPPTSGVGDTYPGLPNSVYPPKTSPQFNGGVSPIRDRAPAALPIQSGGLRDLNEQPQDAPRNDVNQKPAAMMRAALNAPPNSRLAGEWVTLDDVVVGAPSRSDQSERIEAYWDLCSSLADYFLGLREQDEIGRLRQLFPRANPTLEQAEKNLAVRVNTAERAARASQLRLANLCNRGADRLPLPANPPHCGSYQTRHDQVFAGRASVEAEELNRLIPLRYAELQDACAAVTRSEDFLTSVATSRAAVDENTILRALELLALQRRAFVQIARDYNRRISRYVELAAPGQVEPDQLIGMLIKRDRPATATRPASAGPPFNRQSQNGAGVRYSEASGGWMPSSAADAPTARRDDAVTPVSAEDVPMEPGERSLLVPRRS